MICSYACAINNGSEVVLTVGFGNRRDVSVYSMSGFVRNLPDLNVGRQYHACARYQNQYDQNVYLLPNAVPEVMIAILGIFGGGWLHRT